MPIKYKIRLLQVQALKSYRTFVIQKGYGGTEFLPHTPPPPHLPLPPAKIELNIKISLQSNQKTLSLFLILHLTCLIFPAYPLFLFNIKECCTVTYQLLSHSNQITQDHGWPETSCKK